MGSLYPKNGKIYFRFKDSLGKWRGAFSGFEVGEEDAARLELEKLERGILAENEHGLGQHGPMTFRRYAAQFIAHRKEHGFASYKDDETRLKHAMAQLGDLRIKDIRPRHVTDLILTLKGAGHLAPRSVRHVYGIIHTMFEDAVVDELIFANPAKLKKGVLPKKKDKDPHWRPTAVFTQEELEALLYDVRIDDDRRTLYAVLFLTGIRIGEAAALRWKYYDASAKPLGKLVIATSYQRKQKREKDVKVEDKPREVPVHPVLASILAHWKLSGYHRFTGLRPTPGDLILPNSTATGMDEPGHHAYLKDPSVLERLHRDLEMIGLRGRRTHDTRRTFISHGIACGADRNILEAISHGAKGDVFNLYLTLPWAKVCEEMLKVRVGPNPAIQSGSNQ